jgi:tetratricopeptide (TPR) repeat protein
MWEQIAAKIGWAMFWGKLKSVFGGKKVKITQREVELPIPGGRSIWYFEKITEVPLAKGTMTLLDGGVEAILTSPATAETMVKVLTLAGAKELEEAGVRMEKIKQREDAERLVETAEVKDLPEQEKLRFSSFAFIAYGDESFHSDDFSEAEKAYLKAYEFAQQLDDKHLQGICLNLVGAVIGIQGKLEEALPLFDKALVLLPECADAWNNKGVALGMLGRYKEAISCYDETIKLEPDDATTWFNKGVQLDNLNQYEEAISCYNAAIRVKRDFAEAWNNKGMVLHNLRRYKKAIVCFDKAIALKRDFAEAWYNKGAAVYVVQRRKEALSCFDYAIKLKLDFAEAWYGKGVVLLEPESAEEALACFDEALKLDPVNADGWYSRGVALWGIERFDDMMYSFDKALALTQHASDRGASVFFYLTTFMLMQGITSVGTSRMKMAEWSVSQLVQLRKKAEKDDVAQVVDQAIAKFKAKLSKRVLKDFRKFEIMLEEAKSRD